MRKHLLCFYSIILILSLLSFLPVRAQAQETNGNISFEPNIIPELSISFVEEFFRFQWRENRFDLKLLIHIEGKDHSLRDFWELTDRLVEWETLAARVTESMYEFGYMISDIPIEIADKVEYLVWKIEGASFDVTSSVTDEVIEVFEEGYNITRFHLPDNLVLSYEDLWLYDFTVEHPNKHETIVKGVKGKTSWNLDPITFSANIMTMTDYGSEGSYASNLFWEFWNASDANNWNVSEKTDTGEDTQFTFGCRLQIGNGTEAGASYVYDENVQVVFNSTSISANYQLLIDVTTYSRYRLGNLVDEPDKITDKGVSIFSTVTAYKPRLDIDGLYGCLIYGPYMEILGLTTAEVYNCIFCYTYNFYAQSVDIYNLIIEGGLSTDVGIARGSGTVEKLFITKSFYGVYFQTSYTPINIQNFVLRQARAYSFLCNAITVDKNLTNPDVDSWTFGWSGTSTAEVYRRYTFDLTVIYPNGTAIENANVTVKHYGQGETQDFTELTDSNGQISQKTLSMGFYNQTGGNTIYSYNPYHIEITNVTDYQDYDANFTLSEQTEWTLSLTPEPYNWFGPTIIIGLLACFMFVIALTTKK